MWQMKGWLVASSLALALAWSTSFSPVFAQDGTSFDDWLADLRQDAKEAGISSAIIEASLAGIKPIPEVVELDRRQPEGRLTFQEYNRRVLATSRIERGQALYKQHKDLLQRVARHYGVQARFIVALWGIETSYGGFQGGHDVVPALATLAFDGRRADFFRSELIAALRILDEGHITPEKMRGSWAGAMGQSQFMPSSFLRFAVDFDGDGKRDIWNSLPDIFASIANYLAGSGWDDTYTWGRKVRPASAKKAPSSSKAALKIIKSLPEWQSLGVRRTNGQSLPNVALDASFLHTDEGDGPAYLVYNNFRVLMDWNRSTYFAITVGELADLIKQG
ncbi:MAG: lytic murein transglycosylase [Geminicoccales bacterium]